MLEEPLFTIEQGNIGTNEGLKTPTFRIPELDYLKAVHKNALGPDSEEAKKFDGFYTFTVHTDRNKVLTATFLFTNQKALTLLADDNAVQENDGSHSPKSYKELTFKSFQAQEPDFDFSLPFIPQQGFFTMNSIYTETTKGMVREFDPECRSGTGDRHVLSASKKLL